MFHNLMGDKNGSTGDGLPPWYNKELVAPVPSLLGCSHLQNENLQLVLTCNLGTEKTSSCSRNESTHDEFKAETNKMLDIQAYLYTNYPTLLAQHKN